jgi:hypothetical protein
LTVTRTSRICTISSGKRQNAHTLGTNPSFALEILRKGGPAAGGR